MWANLASMRHSSDRQPPCGNRRWKPDWTAHVEAPHGCGRGRKHHQAEEADIVRLVDMAKETKISGAKLARSLDL